MEDIPPEDLAVYAMLCKGESLGVFQVESRAQMTMLPRLRPRTFYDLVIEVAIVRPGPIQGGMVHPYLRRRQGAEPVTYPSDAVKGVLARTLGVPIFQEQVMQLAIVAAGFTAGESDQLRRSMAAWRRRGGLEHLQRRLLDGMKERGYTAEFADQIFRQIQGFASYGFPESHAASFGLLVYVSAWLKHHEPAAFTAGLLNSQPMGFYAPAQLVQDARRNGVEVRAVSVLVSGWDCSLETDTQGNPALRLGLRLVRGLPEASALRIVDARAERRFTSVEDLAHRARLDRRDLKCLAAADAMDGLAGNRREAHWLVAGVETQPLLHERTKFDEQLVLFSAPSEGQDIVDDYAAVGLTLRRHPVALLRPKLARLRMLTAVQLRKLRNGQLAQAAGIVINRQRPETASGVIFMTLEDETGHINVVVWRDLVEKQRSETLSARLLAVHGVLQREGEVTHLVARRLVDHTALLGRLATQSRDFH
jgi:error-prone DNA polymerase